MRAVRSNYGEQDVVAQGNFTEAIFDWLDDENNVHPTHLKQSLAEFNLLLGIYYSGITNEIIELPFEPARWTHGLAPREVVI